jgi:hypothetical protein
LKYVSKFQALADPYLINFIPLVKNKRSKSFRDIIIGRGWNINLSQESSTNLLSTDIVDLNKHLLSTYKFCSKGFPDIFFDYLEIKETKI